MHTQIIPLVVIERFTEQFAVAGQPDPEYYDRVFLSTNNIEVDGYYFKPLLLNIPRIKQNFDTSTGKYQTSSVTLNISNIDYNNSKRLSDKFDSYNLINTSVCIYYKSQSCSTLQLPEVFYGVPNEGIDIENGCPKVFIGVIRDVTHSKDKISLSLEDISHKKINRDLPVARLGSWSFGSNKYKNS